MDEVLARLYDRLPTAKTADQKQAIEQIKREIERLSNALQAAAFARGVLCDDIANLRAALGDEQEPKEEGEPIRAGTPEDVGLFEEHGDLGLLPEGEN